MQGAKPDGTEREDRSKPRDGMEDVLAAIEERKERHLGDLVDFLRIPSVSAVIEHASDVRRCAESLVHRLRAGGIPVAEVLETGGHPVVYAEWRGAPGAPTVLVYGHYDVQPADPLSEWVTPPFEPSVREGQVYACGAADDKGQLLAHVEAVETILDLRGRLPVNWKLMAEGEEEVGSTHLAPFLEANAGRLAADVVVVSDTNLLGPGIPTICVGLRGLAYMEIHVQGPSVDLHSGGFGGGIANPANALATIVAGLKDSAGRVTIPGFYDRVRPLSAEEREDFARLPFDEQGWLAHTGAPEAAGEHGYTTLERIWARPTLDVNGLVAGYTGEGAKTVLPARATAKVSMRLVSDQDPDEIAEAFERHVRAISPRGVRIEIVRHAGGRPFLLGRDSAVLGCARRAFERAMGKSPVLAREGGSIPFVEAVTAALGAPCLLVGFGLPDDNAHAPNEHFSLESYRLAIRTVALLLDELARLAR